MMFFLLFSVSLPQESFGMKQTQRGHIFQTHKQKILAFLSQCLKCWPKKNKIQDASTIEINDSPVSSTGAMIFHFDDDEFYASTESE